MGYQPLEQLLPKAGNSVYRLILLASKRASELSEGMPKLIDFPTVPKATTIALDEIQEGKVVERGSEGQMPQEEQSAPAAKKEEDEKEAKE